MDTKKPPIHFSPIGQIETSFDDKIWVPRQGRYDQTAKGTAVVYPEFADGLKSLSDFSYCWILFYFNRSSSFDLLQRPPKDDRLRGVFSIRSPRRPNGIGMTVVKIEKIENNKIYFTGADMINGTPLIDIKPYVEDIDSIQGAGRGSLRST